MHKKEYDGSVVVDGCESFKHSEKCGGCESFKFPEKCEGCNNCAECSECADVVLINKDALWDSFSGRTPGGGTKKDTGKTRLDLIPTEAIEQLGRAFTHGAEKYGDYNYRKGIDCSRLYGAALRHLNAYWGGEDIDKDSGLPHLALAGSEICMLMVTGPERDDRYKDGE
jgi:hypothetical protein